MPAHLPPSKDTFDVLLPDSVGLDARPVGIDGNLAPDVQPTPAALALPPDNAPLDIGALLLACESHLPVSVILCRSASLAPFGLPADRGCVFLGFFFVSDVDVTSTVELREESTEGWTTCGRRTWIFDFEWTPGGEDADAPLAGSMIPWWMTKPELSAKFGESASEATEATESTAEGAQLGHGFTLLPLHFLASSQFGDEIRGWHCKACGKINVQRNLCIQHCSACSTSNALAAVSIEYVRQVHGMDPVTFPMDRATASVVRSSSEALDGLRDFAYAFSTTACIHHLFTKNHAGVQEEPNRLFHDLQTDIEISSSSPTNGTRNGARKSHAVYVAEFSASHRSAGGRLAWPTSTPECVSRARGLMLRRSRLETYAADLTINCIAINAWRRAGKKRGSLMAKDAPVVILALGADIDVSFVRDSVAPAPSGWAAPPKSSRLSLPTAPAGVDVSQGNISDSDSEAQDVSWSTGPITKKRKTPKGKSEEILTVTLVHGDMLVVEGGVFEVRASIPQQ
ncbi:hypothetical protein C8Q74DRAFT_529940 [Fomes fomentarius]|nr:hypothetical protein C8Q74DRAFT_529940 [Fomes fomentarius]